MSLFTTLWKKLMNKLPETDCPTCLRIRYESGKAILAFETAASRALGLKVGQQVEKTKIPPNAPICVELPEVTPADMITYRQRLGLTQEQFATKFGVSMRDVRKWESGEEPVDFDKLNLGAGAVYATR